MKENKTRTLSSKHDDSPKLGKSRTQLLTTRLENLSIRLYIWGKCRQEYALALRPKAHASASWSSRGECGLHGTSVHHTPRCHKDKGAKNMDGPTLTTAERNRRDEMITALLGLGPAFLEPVWDDVPTDEDKGRTMSDSESNSEAEEGDLLALEGTSGDADMDE
uniref:Uncharacterized protein n=1 Tax=Solanum tuberosum TaxID=4113 RepID=M1DFI2_SOLTU